jgi:predicted Zn-dependent protease
LPEAQAIDVTLLKVAALLESDPAAAARAAQELVRAHPGNKAAVLLLGTAQRRCGDVRAASAAFAELVAKHPDSAAIRLELARALSAQGDAQRAREALERAVQLEPDLAEAWRELSLLYAARGAWHECDAAYARYAGLAHPDDRWREAAAAIAQERLDYARTLLERGLARDASDVTALRLLAQIAVKREDFAEGERLLTECLRLAPGYSQARFDLAEMLHTQQKAQPMLPLLERLLALEPHNVGYRALQAAAYSLLGQSARALSILAELVVEFPENAIGWMYYGHALRGAGRTAEAVEAYRRSAQLQPTFGEAWFSLANLKTFRFTEEDIAAMRAQLESGDLTDEDRWHFEFSLGNALESAGNFAGSFAAASSSVPGHSSPASSSPRARAPAPPPASPSSSSACRARARRCSSRSSRATQLWRARASCPTSRRSRASSAPGRPSPCTRSPSRASAPPSSPRSASVISGRRARIACSGGRASSTRWATTSSTSA